MRYIRIITAIIDVSPVMTSLEESSLKELEAGVPDGRILSWVYV